MFRSRARDLVIPQMEHARFAGVMAACWGNSDFECPVIGIDSFVRAANEHERGYGEHDNFEVYSMSFEDWFACRERTVRQKSQDTHAEMLIGLHNISLMKQNDNFSCRNLLFEVEQQVKTLLSGQVIPRFCYENIFSMLKLCDAASYHFCMEVPAYDEIAVSQSCYHSRVKQVKVVVLGNGRMTVSPWPFNVEEVSGEINGYMTDSYPTQLKPVRIPFYISDGTALDVSAKQLQRSSFQPYGPFTI